MNVFWPLPHLHFWACSYIPFKSGLHQNCKKITYKCRNINKIKNLLKNKTSKHRNEKPYDTKRKLYKRKSNIYNL